MRRRRLSRAVIRRRYVCVSHAAARPSGAEYRRPGGSLDQLCRWKREPSRRRSPLESHRFGPVAERHGSRCATRLQLLAVSEAAAFEPNYSYLPPVISLATVDHLRLTLDGH